MKQAKLAAVLAAASLAGCTDLGLYTLYRNSVFDDSARIRMATFSNWEGSEFNRENCDLVSSLLQQQPGVKVRFWCEPGW